MSKGSRRTNWQHCLFSPQAFVRLAILAAICPILGLFGELHWFLDLFNHLQLQYFVALLLITVVLLLGKHPRLAGIAAVLLLIPSLRLAPLYLPASRSDSETTIRAASFNVLGSNDDYAATTAWILETDPDFIYLPETDSKWSAGLAKLSERYPYVIDFPYKGNFGFCFHSKHPIQSKEIHFLGKLDLPLLEVIIDSPHGPLTIFGAHPVPPVSDFWASERDTYLGELTKLCMTTDDHAVILGDLNATRWSCELGTILDHYRDSSLGQGYSATWMRNNWLVTIPIDHIFSRGFQGTVRRHTGPNLGSDHRPVIADLAW